MKNKILMLLSVFLFIGSAFSQDMNKKYNDPKLNREVLVGYCNLEGLQRDEFGEIFIAEYEMYQPQKLVLKKIKHLLKKNEFDILMVFGDWCGDSQEQIPRFSKILDKVKYNEDRLKIIAVDRSKNAQLIDISELNIKRVPTLIVYYKNREIGRIIETPQISLEEDFLNILESAKFK